MIKFWMDRLVRVGIILLIAFVVSGTLSQANARRVGIDAGEFIDRYKVTLDSIGDMLEHVRQGDLNYSNGYCEYRKIKGNKDTEPKIVIKNSGDVDFLAFLDMLSGLYTVSEDGAHKRNFVSPTKISELYEFYKALDVGAHKLFPYWTMYNLFSEYWYKILDRRLYRLGDVSDEVALEYANANPGARFAKEIKLAFQIEQMYCSLYGILREDGGEKPQDK